MTNYLGIYGKFSSEMIKYNGESDKVAWLKKAELVAKLTDIKYLACFITRVLDGDALALYLEMIESDQLDAKNLRLMERWERCNGRMNKWMLLPRSKAVDRFCRMERRGI